MSKRHAPAPPHVEIPLTRGFVAIVDAADAERVRGLSWYASISGGRAYAQARMGKARVLMHRLLLAAAPRVHVDHINGNTLDNRRANLRVCRPYQNAHNRHTGPVSNSGFIGVQQFGQPDRWRAMLRFNNRRLHLGVFTDPAEAARVRDHVAKALLGEFAALNFPLGSAEPNLPAAARRALERYRHERQERFGWRPPG